MCVREWGGRWNVCVWGAITGYIKGKGGARAEVSGQGHGGPHSKQKVWLGKKTRPKFGGHKAKSKSFHPPGKLMKQHSHPIMVGRNAGWRLCLWARVRESVAAGTPVPGTRYPVPGRGRKRMSSSFM